VEDVLPLLTLDPAFAVVETEATVPLTDAVVPTVSPGLTVR